jgi:hypothetical protein
MGMNADTGLIATKLYIALVNDYLVNVVLMEFLSIY